MVFERFICCSVVVIFLRVHPAHSAKYILLSPLNAVPGRDLGMILHTFQTTASNLNVSVTDSRNRVLNTFTSTLNASGTTKLFIKVSSIWPAGIYSVSAAAVDGSFNARSTFEVTSKSCSIFIQSDKAIYKPSQTVKFRAIVTTEGLKPYAVPITARIQDANGNRIMQWVNQSTTMGVASFELPLSNKPPLGNWTIHVAAGTQEQSKSFEVSEYTLPRFQVTVNLPTYVRANQNKVSGSLVALYTYGENVEGTAVLTFALGLYSIKKTFNVNGRASFELSKSDLDSLRILTSSSQVLTATASFTETLTGSVLTGSSSCPVSNYDAQVQFMSATSDYFKAGVNYTAYIQVSRPDGSLLGEPNLVLALRASYTSYAVPSEPQLVTVFTGSTTVPLSGVVSMTFRVPDGQLQGFVLEASLNYGTDIIAATKWINRFRTDGSSDIGLSLLNPKSGSFRSGDTAAFSVRLLQPLSTWHYIVTARGRILSAATVPSTVTSFDVVLNVDHAPQTTVLVYMVAPNNELVADSVTISVSGALQGKVTLGFHDSGGLSAFQVKPGGNVTLYIESAPQSLVGLLVVDQSVLLLKGGNDITNNQLLEELQSFSKGSSRGSPELFDFMWPRWGGSDTSQIFSAARVSVITDASMTTNWILEDNMPIMQAALPKGAQDAAAGQNSPASTTSNAAPPRTRSYFPETWIWSTVQLNEQGKGSIAQPVPDTITSWVTTAFSISARDGLAVTDEPSKLKVFQDFFVSAILPYSIVRGEEVALKIVVFNYMSSVQTVSVTLLQSSFFNARLNDIESTQKTGQNFTQTVVVPANSGSTALFWITPRVLGMIKIVVFALSPAGGDVIENDLLVKPEGVEQGYCLSEFVSLQKGGRYNKTFNIQYPPNVVADSRRVEVQVSGDIMGPSIKGLDKLVQVPFGCGEQNMITFTPNIFVRKYTEAVGLADPDLQSKTYNNMLLGYQRELTYWRKDGYFSAFGDSDEQGSTWLTAFVLKSFRQALPYLKGSIDENVLSVTKTKLLQKQSASGAFIESGRVIHSDMQGGSGSGETMAAYVLIALLEDNPSTDDLLAPVAKTVSLLESSLNGMASDPYRLAITTYALVLAKSSRASAALSSLESLAQSKDGMLHWGQVDASSSAPACHYCPKPSGASAIEMTSYGLLTYAQLGSLVKASQVAKWLATQRNALGGFSSTQDTVLALQALAAFARLARPDDFSLSLSFQADGNNAFPEIFINTANSLLLQSAVAQRPDSLSSLSVTASGYGSAVVSACVSYYSLAVPAMSLVDLNVVVVSPSEKVRTTDVHACATSTSTSKASNGMGIIKVYLASGYAADVSAILAPSSLRRIDSGLDDSVALYFDEFTSSPVCVTVPIQAAYMVNSVKDAHVEAYHYYSPDQGVVSSYNPVSGAVERTTAAAINSAYGVSPASFFQTPIYLCSLLVAAHCHRLL